MKAVGIVVEYNPFHNGHLYHLESAKEITGADIAIAAMSGSFLQRGEPALVSKWARTKMALLNGVDIVFELPYKFSTQKAELFARGAVSILDAAGCSHLCFGSESGEAGAFEKTAAFIDANRPAYDGLIKKYSKTGVSYPRAASLAFADLNPPPDTIPLSQPNNILGYHYVKSISSLNSRMKPMTVRRKNANYHDEDFSSATIASATSLRKALFAGDSGLEGIGRYIPGQTRKILLEYMGEFGGFHNWESYWPFLKYRLLQSSPEDLGTIYEAEEGLENRLVEAARRSANFQEFMEFAKTKRYTWTRIQRLCTHVLVNAKKEEMAADSTGASYLRLLGMTEKGRSYLNMHKGTLGLPLVSKLSSFPGTEINLDIRASAVYSLGIPGTPGQNLLEMEYSQPPVLIEKG
ncbi:nucleotidyltransferase [Neobacillus piezotolerans]|uniref:tRNA(Met) cytidine acetate ligase n=1 Tax=Neobacillus piezotolerans TaxID=2259171 RepID=A0A3D8GVJ9_9BACI|nr:nucleotidyltransferase [Neobacillus piezotolerans]RDU38467.1 nucleotidyltransferase [Neobacillus piezotolerans]